MDIGGLIGGAVSHVVNMKNAADMIESLAKTGKAPAVLLAPNGKPSNLTPKQWAEVRSPQFKKGFGDWEIAPENATITLDENGEPQVFFHGTTKAFTSFDNAQIGTDPSKVYSAELDGHVFTTSPAEASIYASNRLEDGIRNSANGWKLNQFSAPVDEGARVIPVYLNVRRPFDASNGSIPSVAIDRGLDRGKLAAARANGADGIVASKGGHQVVVAFNPTQIKSALSNNGNFDMTNPNIYKALMALPLGGAMLGAMNSKQGGQ